MTKYVWVFLWLAIIFVAGNGISFASVDGSGNIIFTDADLKTGIIAAGVDTNTDGEISEAEAEAVTTLDVSGYTLSSLDGMEHFTNLTSFTANDCLFITDASPLSGLSELTYVEVTNSRVNSVTPFASLSKLVTLNLSENLVGDLDPLNGHPALQTINVNDNNLWSFEFFTNLPTLEYLYARNQWIENVDGLSGLTSLRELGLGSNVLTDIDGLAGLTNLDVLWVYSNDITDLSPIEDSVNLTELYIFGNSNLSDLATISGFQNLTTLSAGNTSIVNIDVLADLTNLEDVNLVNSDVNEIWPLSGLPNLASLDLTSAPLYSSSTPGALHKTELDFTVDGTDYEVWMLTGTDSNLKDISISEGTLSPVFDALTTAYTASVANNISSLTITPSQVHPYASLKVNGTSVTSGNASAAIVLSTGDNTIPVLVTAEDGSEKTYTITVTRLQSSNNALASISLDDGTLVPTFDSNIFSYEVNVDNEVETVAYNDLNVTSGSAISIALTKEDTESSLAFNGTTIDNVTTSWSDALAVGNNTVTITVTAENGSTRDYTIVVSRDSSANNNLSKLTASDSSISPDFDNNITSYTMLVDYSDTDIGFVSSGTVSGAAITVNPVVDDSTASLEVNGESLSGSTERTFDLEKGDNTFTMTVTAEDGSEKDYSLVVTRGESSNYYLSNLLISDGLYSIDFDKDTNNYSVSVPYSRRRITITAVTAHEDASMTIDGVGAESGVESDNLVLDIGKNTFDIEVTAGSGITKIYRVNIVRLRASSSKDRDENESSFTEETFVTVSTASNSNDDISLEEINTPASIIYEVLTISEKKILSATIEAKHEEGVSKARIFKELMQGILNEKRIREGSSNNGNNDDHDIEVYVKDAFFDLELEMMKEAIELIVNEDVTALRIQTDRGTVQFDEKAINTISEQSQSDLVTLIVEHDDEFQSDDNRLNDRPIIDLSLIDQENEINDFGDGKAYVEIPYDLKDDESAESIVVYFIDDQGLVHHVRGSYDAESKTVNFVTSHFSKYVIGYNPVKFKDVQEDEWYYKAVRYITARSIASGKSHESFGPNDDLTRGQLVVMLMNAYQIDPSENAGENFDDAGDAYYSIYLSKAKELGIVSGNGDNMFNPEKEVSRQELCVLVYNTLKYTDEVPDSLVEIDIANYIDFNKVEPWAETAIDVLVEARVINGSRVGYIDPGSFATRAELAQLLYNLLN